MNERAIFVEALKKQAPSEQAEYLDLVCGDDAGKRSRVEALLRAHGNAGSFLAKPAAAAVATIDMQSVLEKPGTQIGPYQLREQIGEGGFGVVYVAEQKRPVARKVALKVIKPGMDTKDVIARFEAERQALALMDHPNVARVLDAGATDSGRPYFVMELVRGAPITRFCDEQKLPTRERLGLFVDVCRAVQHAHQKGIIHRDLKPSNVMVALHDDKPVVKVIDFGVSKALSAKLTEKTVYTAYGQMVGTPLYMSPEQAQLSGLDVDTRSDVYSLGVLLYELLTGTTPFDKETLQNSGFEEMRRIIREVDPPRPSNRVSTLEAEALSTVSDLRNIDPRKLGQSYRGELDWIVMKALEKDRNRRYESASAFAVDVERFLADEPVQARPASVWYRFWKFARRKKGTLAAAAVLCFALLIAIGTIAGSLGYIARDRDARQTRTAVELDLILDDVDRLMEQRNWPQALVMAQRAESVLAAAEAAPVTRRRVNALLNDLKFLNRLEEIRMQRAKLIVGKFNYDGADRDYARAFREYGVDIEQLPTEVSVARLKGRPAFAVAVAAALDDWVQTQRALSKGTDSWKRLVAVARGIDPDPLRDRMRDWWGKPVTPERQAELRRLAESLDLDTQPPATTLSLYYTLQRTKQPEVAIRFLQRSQLAYQDDYWLNYDLSWELRKRKDYNGAIRFATAALAIRPESVAALTNLGRALRDQGAPEQAIACLRKAIELDPKYGGAYNHLGLALFGQGKQDEAIACFQKAIELDAKDASAHVNLGLALHARGDLSQAVASFHRAIEIDPQDAVAHSNLGRALQQQGKMDEAVACFQKAVNLAPKLAEAHTNLGLILDEQGKLEEAIACYHQAVSLNPNLAPAHYNLGNHLFLKRGELDEAITCYRKAIEIDPEYARAHHNLGAALSRQGKRDEAIACYRKAIEIDPENAAANNSLGAAWFRQGELDEAIACFRKAIEIDPAHATAHRNLGRSLTLDGKLDQSISCYRKAIELDPEYAPAHRDLGVLFRDQGKPIEAIACFRKAISINPKDAKSHGDLGIVLMKQGKLDEAIACFRKAIELDPESAPAHDNLGLALQQQGKLDEAIGCFRKVIRFDPNNAHAHNELAWLLATADPRVQDHGTALNSARRAVDLAPRTGPFWNTLGVAHYRNGDWKAAIDALHKSMELQKGGHGTDYLFLAMSHWQIGEKDRARQWYEKAVAWMDEHKPKDDELLRFHAEAKQLLGIDRKPVLAPSPTKN